LKARHRAAGSILIDVLPAPRKPPDWPEGKIWRQPEHQNLPGTAWLPNVGYGELSAEFAEWFESELDRLTEGDKTRPIVFYCEAGCWMSWNAAKRALELGYTDVIWFPGHDGWAAAGQFMVPAELPDMPEFVPLERPGKAASGSCKETPCASPTVETGLFACYSCAGPARARRSW
jgi:PQQ-dependent catabolism-associated CXXCW motif protein